jgi:hypothetical protein
MLLKKTGDLGRLFFKLKSPARACAGRMAIRSVKNPEIFAKQNLRVLV